MLVWEHAHASAAAAASFKSAWRLESPALPLGWRPRRLPKPAAFSAIDASLRGVLAIPGLRIETWGTNEVIEMWAARLEDASKRLDMRFTLPKH
jgi:hypothetical protein